ncbi:failed axon connections homolog [Rhopilema esculentum]|uniref:failed axon connections homolog n=1 Tax=Rhopilema esculentum TaxID=499914 RepID=UPI0031D559FD|eukprot:gene11851-2395_t
MAEVETVQTVTETVEVTETKTVTTSADGTVTEVTVVKTVESGDSHGQEEAKPAEAVQVEVKENGGAEPAKDEEPPVVEKDGAEGVVVEEKTAEKVEVQEEKKEEGPPKVILHQFPPVASVPSLSPFCLKLETFLRMNKIPYENVHSLKVGKKGKMPWIEYKGERISDSSFIIDYLNKTFEIDMDKNLSKSEKAQSRALKVMLEEQSYFTLMYSRWVDEFNEFKKVVSTHQKGIGFAVTFKMNQRKARSTLDHQGIGRHSKEEIYKIAEQDLRALSDYLGEKPYMMGAEATTLDATAFGLLANIVYSGLESPQFKMVKEEFCNLADYVERLKSEFWVDWNEMVLGDKPEHTHIRRRFSFKTGKKKAKEVKKEENSSEEEKPEEGKADADKSEEPAPAEGEAKPEAAEDGEGKVEESKPGEKTEETAQVNGEASESEKAEAEAQ